MLSLLFLSALTLGQTPARVPAANVKTAAQAAPAGSSATPLSFREFFESGQRELKPSAKLLSLNGKRVRIVGFMAQTEEHFKGGFFLCPRPVDNDEAAGGDADIPPESVFVVLRSAKGKEPAHKPQALIAVGILELGPKEDDQGRVTRIRLILDGPKKLPAARASRAVKGKASGVGRSAKK